MIIRAEKVEKCEVCGEEITLRSYEGLDEDAWYTSHTCEKILDIPPTMR